MNPTEIIIVLSLILLSVVAYLAGYQNGAARERIKLYGNTLPRYENPPAPPKPKVPTMPNHPDMPKISGLQFTWTLEKVKSMNHMEVLHFLEGYLKMLKEDELIIQGMEEGAEEWRMKCSDLEHQNRRLKEFFRELLREFSQHRPAPDKEVFSETRLYKDLMDLTEITPKAKH